MKSSTPNSNNHSRKQQATISSTVVRCICITASCIVTACGLLGFGVTCFAIRLADPSAAPCPYLMTVIVFGVAGLLFFVSFFFLLVLCKRRDRLRRKAMLEDLPVACVDEFKPIKEDDSKKDEGGVKANSENPEGPQNDEEHFDTSQKSADVSLWIERQENSESAVDCFPLENRDGGPSQEANDDSADEITPL